MADTEIENATGFVDVRRLTNDSGRPGTVHTTVNYNDVSDLRTRLLAIGGYYTAAVLNNMTKNDMVYAVRQNDDAAGIK